MPAFEVIADEPVKALADEFRAIAASRRDATPSDIGVEAFAYCARRVDEIRRDTAARLAMCSAAEYAMLPHVGTTPTTVRRWCAAGQLPGAVQTATQEWKIPKLAKRVQAGGRVKRGGHRRGAPRC